MIYRMEIKKEKILFTTKFPDIFLCLLCILTEAVAIGNATVNLPSPLISPRHSVRCKSNPDIPSFGQCDGSCSVGEFL
jgi:hypothetical protein